MDVLTARIARLVLGAALLTSAGCDAARIARGNVLSLGDPCTEKSRCRAPLVCSEEGTCQPAGTALAGESCTISLDCAADLYCAAGVCAPAGAGAAGAVCASSADCQRGLRCAFSGLGGTCAEAGDGYVDAPCTSGDQCMAGLLCDPISDECSVSLSRPAGVACQSDLQCMPQVGIVCLESGECGGRGPDGAAVPPWSGVSCEDSFALHGDFRAYFEVPGAANADFFRLPFPNDARVDPSTGRIDLEGFPTPPLASVPSNLLERYLLAIEADQQRFGPNQSVFLRFSGPPAFCGQGCGEAQPPASEDGCIGNGETAPGIYVVDLTRTSGAFKASPFTPIPYRWTATSADRAYICGPWLAVLPDAARGWVPGGTYAVLVHARVKGCDGETRVGIVRDADFDAMLASSAPGDARLTRAWNAYEPLRAWLATNPTYPDATAVAASDIVGGTVFTIGDPTTPMLDLRAQVASAPAPVVSGVSVCAAASAVDECSAPGSFTEVHGVVTLPSFQTGTAPYFEAGGGISATQTGDVQARFSLTVPVESGGCVEPAGGWPVVIYGHGTGGDYRTHVVDGVVELLSNVSVTGGGTECFAVLGIDQVAHGARSGNAAVAPDLLFLNFGNPQAARGNVLQAAADQLSLQRAIGVFATAIAGQAALGGATLDATQVAYLGHSQGGVVGSLALAVSPDFPVGVLSGAGGGLLDTFTNKTSPYDLLTIFRFVLADPRLSDAREHPALSLVQGYLEPADPVNYGGLINAAPPTGSVAKSVLHLVGVGDTYTPNVTGMTLARRVAGAYMDTSPASGLLRGGESSVAGPVTKNKGTRTVVTSVHAPPTGRDGHFVLFDDAKAKERAAQFLGTWQTATDGAPTVVP